MENLRSKRSDEKAYVRFLNLTERTVEVIWINFFGAYVSYRLLEKGHFVDVNTYKRHPWIVVDNETRDRLHIEKEFVYFPKTTKEHFRNRYPNREYPPTLEARITANITIPVYSLRYKCLLTIKNFLHQPEDVNSLELPNELLNDLKKVITQRNNLIVHYYIRDRDHTA